MQQDVDNTSVRAASRYCNVFESYYVDRHSDSCDNGYFLV